jgi:hypothetical protein
VLVAGFFLQLMESAATAIGAGILIGTFWAGTVGLVKGRTRKSVEGDSLRYGYIGALVAVLALIVEVRNV